MKDGYASYALDRKIQVVTIKSIGMSNLRDDWLVSAIFRGHLVGIHPEYTVLERRVI